MSEYMYKHILDNKHLLRELDLVGGTVTTIKGSHGAVCSSTGYLRVKLGGKSIQVHQILAVMYFGIECIGKQVNHIDGNKINNTKENLEVITNRENIQHQWLHASQDMLLNLESFKKLSDEQVLEIRSKYPKGYRFSSGELLKLTQSYGLKSTNTMRNVIDIVSYINVT